MKNKKALIAILAAIVVIVAALLIWQPWKKAETPATPAGEGAVKVGVSMPTKDLQRWNQDGENMEKLLKEAGYEVELQFASNDVPTQLAQVETMIDNGCKVVVIAAIEGSSLGKALDKAAEKGVKVIAYDRLLMDNEHVDYYATFDNYKVGTVQGTYVKDTLKLDEAEGPFNFEFTAGDPGDNNAGFFFNGAMDVLKPYIDSGKVVVKSGQTEFSAVATPGWKSETAQKRAEDILAANYADGAKIDAWVCSNDSTALGVTNALEANYDVAGLGWPIITGQDCDKTNVKNMIAGKQSMSVFKDTRTLAAQVVKMVGQILKGEKVDVNDEKTYNNNKKVVPSFLCEPVFGDAGNYKTLLIDSGYYTEDDLK
ncbi:MAG: sugar-binding protein [Clostridiales bacterium]|nr:sugar-binding protein [Clostridiales bacterium]